MPESQGGLPGRLPPPASGHPARMRGCRSEWWGRLGWGVLLIAPRADPSPRASREGGEDASLRVEHLVNEP